MKCSVENNGAELNKKCDGEINGLQKGVASSNKASSFKLQWPRYYNILSTY